MNPPIMLVFEGFKGTEDQAQLSTVPITSTDAAQFSDVGDYTITVEGGSAMNYALTTANGTLTVTKAPLTTAAEPKTIEYGESPQLTYHYSGFKGSDNESVIDTAPVTTFDRKPDLQESGSQFLNVGEYTITLSEGTDNNYDLLFEGAALHVVKAVLNVKVQDATKIYGDENPEFTLLYSGFKGSEDATLIDSSPLAGTLADAVSSPGSYAVSLTAGDDNNYQLQLSDGTVTIHPAPLQVLVHDATIEYGEEAQLEVHLSYSGFKGFDDEGSLDVLPRTDILLPATKELGSQFLPVGRHVISVRGAEDLNYSFTYINGSLTITKAPLVAKALDATKVYGDENPVFAISYTGLKGTETPSVIDIAPVSGSTATTLSPVGTYPIVPGGGMDNNYAIANEEGVLSVTQALLTLIADNRSKTYGQEFNMTSLSISYEGFKGADDASVLDVLPTASTSVTETSDAGTYPIVVAGGSAFNYAFAYVAGVFTVNKAILTATADDKTRAYGEANPEFTLAYSGFMNSESASVIDMPPSVLYVADELSPPGTYPIHFDGGSDINYDFILVPGTLTITQLTRPVPGKPTTTCYLTSPENNATNVNYYVTLTSNFVAGANTYTMEVSTQPDFTGTSILKQGRRDIDFLLNYDTRYYVRIQTNQEPGVWSVTSSFTTGNTLTLAYLTSPEDGATGVPTNVKVTANNLYGAKNYTVVLNTRADFTGTSIVATDNARGVSFKKLETGTTYYARVSSDLTPGQWGPVTSFSTRDPRGRSTAWFGDEEPSMETTGISYTLYPNPFKEKITVLVQTLDQQPVVLTLFDLNGKALETRAERTNTLVSVGESVSGGVYLLQLMTPRARKFIRVVKH